MTPHLSRFAMRARAPLRTQEERQRREEKERKRQENKLKGQQYQVVSHALRTYAAVRHAPRR